MTHCRSLVLCLLALVVALPLPAHAEDSGKTASVRCDKGKTIADALDDHHGPLTIQVFGTCHENVVVRRSDVTLVAGAPGAAIQGTDPKVDTLTVTADRFVLDGLSYGLKVNGGRNGIVVTGASQAQLRNCTVRGSGNGIVGGIGIQFSSGASGSVDRCVSSNNPADGIFIDGSIVTITNSTIQSNARNGVFVFGGSTARIGFTNVFVSAPNTISDNGANGIHVSLNSLGIIYGNSVTDNGTNANSPLGRFGVLVVHSKADIPGGNTITGNPGAGVAFSGSSGFIGDPGFGLPFVNTIRGNSTAGVLLALGSAAVVRGAIIDTNNGAGLLLSGRSTASVFSATVTGNSANGLQLSQGSAVLFQPVTPLANIGGNTSTDLQCLDGESSFTGPLNGSPTISCTGF